MRRLIIKQKVSNDQDVFHSAAGTKNAGMYHPQAQAPTPFQMVGSAIKKAGTKVSNAVLGKSIKYSKRVQAQDQENRRKAESGMYNQ